MAICLLMVKNPNIHLFFSLKDSDGNEMDAPPNRRHKSNECLMLLPSPAVSSHPRGKKRLASEEFDNASAPPKRQKNEAKSKVAPTEGHPPSTRRSPSPVAEPESSEEEQGDDASNEALLCPMFLRVVLHDCLKQRPAEDDSEMEVDPQPMQVSVCSIIFHL